MRATNKVRVFAASAACTVGLGILVVGLTAPRLLAYQDPDPINCWVLKDQSCSVCAAALIPPGAWCQQACSATPCDPNQGCSCDAYFVVRPGILRVPQAITLELEGNTDYAVAGQIICVLVGGCQVDCVMGEDLNSYCQLGGAINGWTCPTYKFVGTTCYSV
jgi:hypothetical protein